jgi:hypothetical protein
MNAIIAAATGYSDTDLEPFLASVHRVCKQTKVFLIFSKHDPARMKRLQGKYPFVEAVYVRRKLNRGTRFYNWIPRWIARHFIEQDYSTCSPFWRVVGRYSLHIMLERFFLALELVQANRGSFRNVLLTDSRDVILQEDPFRQIDDNLVSGLEEKTIGSSSVNADWISHLYGTDVYASMAKCRIACAGVTLGPIAEVEQYLIEMCREIWKCLPKVALGSSYDQGIHNYLVYNGRVNVKLTENRTGIIATLLYEDPSNIKTDAAAGVVTVQGKPSAIVHQYDRHANLVAFVRQRLCS